MRTCYSPPAEVTCGAVGGYTLKLAVLEECARNVAGVLATAVEWLEYASTMLADIRQRRLRRIDNVELASAAEELVDCSVGNLNAAIKSLSLEL